MNNRKKGFTLIELLITLSVLVILLAIGAPSLQMFIQNSRLVSQTSGLVGDLNFGRSEAVKLGTPVTVCASADGATCSNALAWETGWIVFSDANADGVVDILNIPPDVILRVAPPLGGNNTLGAGRSVIRFSTQGFSVGFNNTFRACDSRGAASARNVIVSNQGRVTTGQGGVVCP